MATVNIQLGKYRTNKQIKLINMLNDKSVQKQINTYIKDAITPFVPMQSGALRRSAIVTPNSITWGRGLPYARYQYEGFVYKPNLVASANGGFGETFFYSIPGRRKIKSNQKIVYHTPGTRDHWDESFKGFVRLKTNQQITRYLKAECKRRGLR